MIFDPMVFWFENFEHVEIYTVNLVAVQVIVQVKLILDCLYIYIP